MTTVDVGFTCSTCDGEGRCSTCHGVELCYPVAACVCGEPLAADLAETAAYYTATTRREGCDGDCDDAAEARAAAEPTYEDSIEDDAYALASVFGPED